MDQPALTSGGADVGYDIAVYRAVDPDYGDLADLEALIADANQF